MCENTRIWTKPLREPFCKCQKGKKSLRLGQEWKGESGAGFTEARSLQFFWQKVFIEEPKTLKLDRSATDSSGSKFEAGITLNVSLKVTLRLTTLSRRTCQLRSCLKQKVFDDDSVQHVVSQCCVLRNTLVTGASLQLGVSKKTELFKVIKLILIVLHTFVTSSCLSTAVLWSTNRWNTFPHRSREEL